MNKLYKWTMVDDKSGCRLGLLDILITSAMTLICGGITNDLALGIMTGLLYSIMFNLFIGNYAWEYYK